jgi:sarcosine oxidase subunit alpha
VRRSVGLFDGSPLGKIEVRGPDAALFLDRIYANTMSTMKVGGLRYGLMLNELGVIIDDGVTLRLADDRFVVGTTGAGAARMAAWLDEWLQCEWPDLEVLIAPLTSAIAVITLSGPSARDLLSAAGVNVDISPTALPHMTAVEGEVAGVQTRICRVSFTGETSFEINAPARAAERLWSLLLDKGQAFDAAPVGIDAWMLLRTEKGFIHVGADTDGVTVPDDIGWGHVLKRTGDFIGRRSLTRPDSLRPDRHQLVGVEAIEPLPAPRFVPIGAHLVRSEAPNDSEGYVTSSGFSPVLNRGVALAMVKSGRARLGEHMIAITPEGALPVRITSNAAFDPSGSRLRGSGRHD